MRGGAHANVQITDRSVMLLGDGQRTGHRRASLRTNSSRSSRKQPRELRQVLAHVRSAPDPGRVHRNDAKRLIGCVAISKLRNAMGLRISKPRVATRSDHHIVTIFDRNYPTLLREVAKPPIVLFLRGNLDALRGEQIAVVGSRKPSHSGKEIAFRVARALSREGYAITSGLANGIDAAAHRGAIDSGGMTVAVFGYGIDKVYPARNRGLASRVADSAALMSEFPLGSAPLPYNFLRRNRIISGLSLGTLVVEAAAKSGSISTAMYALGQGLEVFAIPGSIRNPMAAGCHCLIKQGATLVDGIADIL